MRRRRAEVGAKTTILGFYGLLPNVQLVVQDLKRPVDRLTFMLICAASDGGRFKVRPQLINPRGESAVMEGLPGELDVVLPANSKRQLLVITMTPLLFPGPGVYAFGLVVDPKQVYRENFDVIQGAVAAVPA